MSTTAPPARIYLLAAREAPYVAIIRRKPTRLIHIARLNTKTNEIQHGSWFRGKIYSLRCDISFDGDWMIYFAMGATSDVWSGVCKLPWLRTSMHGHQFSTYCGGGYWQDRQTLLLNYWDKMEGSVPFTLDVIPDGSGDGDTRILYSRLRRDGWEPAPEPALVQDSGWRNRPTQMHPYLRLWSLGYSAQKGGYTFRFALDNFADLLDEFVCWACWDSLHNLIYARLGVVYKYSLEDLERRKPGALFDLESLAPPIPETEKDSATS